MFGNMIGVGIFLYPSLIANRLSHPIYFFLFWILGGIIAISGALSSAVLAMDKPEVGGDYAYLRNAYGNKISFVYGFIAMVITFPGSIAIGLSLTLHIQGATLFGSFVNEPLGFFYMYQFLGIGIILFLFIINYFGIHSSLFFQRFFTLIPLIFLILTFLWIIFYSIFVQSSAPFFLLSNFSLPFGKLDFLNTGTALVAIYWTYTGWNAPLSLGNEIENAEKVLPRAMILGPIFVMLLYIFFCLIFVSFLPYTILQEESTDIFHSILQMSFGDTYTSKILSLCIFLIIIGNINSAMITGSRILLAMSEDKLMFANLKKLNRYSAPVNSLFALTLFSSLLILFLEKQSKILNLSFICLCLLSILTILSVYKLKKKINLLFRLMPIVYSVSTLFILGLILYEYFEKKEYGIPILSVSVFIIAFLIAKLQERNKK